MAQQKNHRADIRNPNHGTPGTNPDWDKAQGNRGKQLNPNQQPHQAERGKPRAGKRRK
ncbi:hypothetical protein Hoch_0888 [Haliangium ochraceum DSM 14365]|uniref:Uncharacterized protein n=1 Tax=Haliangium ochraceum (strain DSM 14365 / JCM 11303 / SMP-2) TaxID=502025 RepID=D0LPD4_HALO1|nr:hypothetical protein Hoch_0888 [Haliangium ochraceum DSM 14365]